MDGWFMFRAQSSLMSPAWDTDGKERYVYGMLRDHYLPLHFQPGAWALDERILVKQACVVVYSYRLLPWLVVLLWP